jgi:predicted negative regulator of RcsB-dependent stress response
MAKENASQPTPPLAPANATPADIEQLAQAREDVQALRENVGRYGTLTAAILGALFLGIGGYLAYTLWYLPSQEAEAEKKAVQAFNDFTIDSLNRALKGQAPLPGTEKLASEYSGTKVGNLATYMTGVAYLNEGKLDKGSEALNQFNTEKDMVSVTALAAKAYVAEEKNDFTTAAGLYRQAAELVKNEQTTPLYLLEAARCQELAKDYAGALKTYREIKFKYPKATTASNVDKYIAKLSGQN